MVSLRPFGPSDVPRLVGWIDSREALVQWAGSAQFSHPLTAEQLIAYAFASNDPVPSRVVYVGMMDDTTACGHIELGAINYDNESASICRVLVAPELRGRGVSFPMVEEVLRVGFRDLGLRRIDLRVYSFNTPAIRCYEKAGFVREGLLRKAQKVGEQYWDTVLMAILREEWESRSSRQLSHPSGSGGDAGFDPTNR